MEGMEIFQDALGESGQYGAGVLSEGEDDIVVGSEAFETLDVGGSRQAEGVGVGLAEMPEVEGHAGGVLRDGIETGGGEPVDEGSGEEGVLDAEVAFPATADDDQRSRVGE